MNTLHVCFDKLCKFGIKLIMLTGVTFTMTACYGTPPVQYAEDEEYRADSQQVEQLLVPDQETKE